MSRAARLDAAKCTGLPVTYPPHPNGEVGRSPRPAERKAPAGCLAKETEVVVYVLQGKKEFRCQRRKSKSMENRWMRSNSIAFVNVRCYNLSTRRR